MLRCRCRIKIVPKCELMRRYKAAVQVLATVAIFTFLLHPGRFSCSNYEMVTDSHIPQSLVTDETLSKMDQEVNCSTSVIHPKTILQDITDAKSFDETESFPMAPMSSSSSSCPAKYSSYIIVPYRDRKTHLHIFLTFFHIFLLAQNLNYSIVIVEQSGKKSFNRAKLFNIGFAEVTKTNPTASCFIFHDVDLIPINLNNIYACSHRPRHMSVNLDTFRYNLPYPELFGGAIAILADQFRKVNGFSNRFFGWGGEDDDFSMRIRRNRIPIIRFSEEISRYVMLEHVKSDPTKDRYERLLLGEQEGYRDWYEEVGIDGLNSLKYTILSTIKTTDYFHLVVDI